MWLRSDKRELRNRNQPKEKFKNHRKKRKRSRNQYCKTIKLMKKEKSASVLTTKQYSTDELTLYSDKSAKKVVNNCSSTKRIFTANNNKNLSYTSDSAVNQYHHSYDLNNLDIDLNSLRTSSIDAPDENGALEEFGNCESEHFQPLNTHSQYDDGFADECNFDKNSSEIHAVSDMLLSKWTVVNVPPRTNNLCVSGSYEEKCKLTTENVSYTTTDHHHFHNHHQEISYGFDGSSCTNKSLLATNTDTLGGAYISTEDSCNTKNLCLYKDINYDICKTVVDDDTEGTQEFLTQVENNNFNLSYTTANQTEMTQYASCSNVHNISMISSACYNNTSAISYSNNVNYHNTVYPIKDCNKNYEEVSYN